jgi:hypothetical protein
VDQEIELAVPNFIPLAPEEAADAVRLLAALIRAVPAQHADSTFPPRPDSLSPEELAAGLPLARRRLRGTGASRDRPNAQVAVGERASGERASGARPTVLRTASIFLAVPHPFGGAQRS